MASSSTGFPSDDEAPVYSRLRDFQKHFGLSRSGMRLYEEAGIFTPPRDSSNNYRVISMSNGVRMSLALAYARYGIRLKDAGRLVSDCDDEDEIALLQECDDELNREALRLIAKRARLEEHIHHLLRFKNNPRACEFVEGCDFYVLDVLSKDMKYNDNQQHAGAWWANAPFVTGGLIVTLDAEGNGVEMVNGPLTTGGDVHRFNLPAESAIHFCAPQRRYLTGYITFPSEAFPTCETYAHLFAYAGDSGIALDASQVLHRLLRCRDVDGVPMRSDVVYLPVAD